MDWSKKSRFDLKRLNRVDIRTNRQSIIINKIERSSFYLLQGGKLYFNYSQFGHFNKSKDKRRLVERVFKIASIILHHSPVVIRALVC